jgi:hypothetical protein
MPYVWNCDAIDRQKKKKYLGKKFKIKLSL